MCFANEAAAAFKDPEAALEDRKLFVENFGKLLAQTREGIASAYLDANDVVHVVYKGGAETLVNVNMNSYLAIIKDVSKEV